MIIIVGVPQTVLDHGVDDLLVAHAGAPAGVKGGKRGLRHALGAAADDHVGVAGENGAGAFDQGLHAGAADHVYGVGGDGIGDACLNADLSGNVLAETGRQDAAENDLVHVLRRDVRALERFLDDQRAHIHGGGVLQRAAKGTDGGAAAIHDIEFFHGISPFS